MMLMKPLNSLRPTMLITGFLILLIGCVPLLNLGANFEGGEKVTITSPLIENCYLAGEEIFVEANLGGDLTAFGGTIFIRDTVFHDVLLGAGEVQIPGYVGDDLRILAGEIILISDISGDVVVMGGELTIGKEVRIGGDLVILGGTVLVEGTILGQVFVMGGEVNFSGVIEEGAKFRAGQLTLNGEIHGPSQIQAQTIQLGENARFHGDVEYWQTNGEMDFGTSLVNAKATFNPDLETDFSQENWEYMGMGFAGFWVLRLLGVLLFFALMTWLFHNFFARTGNNLIDQPARSLGLGLVYLIGIPILILISFMIVVGIPLGLFIMANYFFLILFSQALATLILAHAINAQYNLGWNKGIILLAAMGGFILLKITSWVPIIGFLVTLIAIVGAIGAIFITLLNGSDTKEEYEKEWESEMNI